MSRPGSPVIPTDAVKHRTGTRTVLLACMDWPGALQGRVVTGSATHDLRRGRAWDRPGARNSLHSTQQSHLFVTAQRPSMDGNAGLAGRGPCDGARADARPRGRLLQAAAAAVLSSGGGATAAARAPLLRLLARAPALRLDPDTRARPRSPGTGSPQACRGARRAAPAERRSRSCALLPRSGAGRLGGGLRAVAAMHEARL